MKIKKIKNKKYIKVRDIGLSSFFLTIFGIASFFAAVFGSGYSLNSIVSSSETTNPFLILIKNGLGFFDNTNNIIFVALFALALFLLYIGLFVLPIVNICKCAKFDNKDLVVLSCFTSPLVFVFLPLFPLVWFLSMILLMAKASKHANDNANDDFNLKTNPVAKNSMEVSITSHKMPQDASAPSASAPSSVLQPTTPVVQPQPNTNAYPQYNVNAQTAYSNNGAYMNPRPMGPTPMGPRPMPNAMPSRPMGPTPMGPRPMGASPYGSMNPGMRPQMSTQGAYMGPRPMASQPYANNMQPRRY